MNKIQKLMTGVSSSVAGLALSASPALASDALGEVEVPSEYFFESVGEILSIGLRYVMVFAAILVFAYLIWGGIEWITSGGDSTKTEDARKKITAAIVGLIILAASYAILELVLRLAIGVSFQDLMDTL